MDLPEGPITQFPANGLSHCSRHITGHSKSGSSIFATSDHGDHHRPVARGWAYQNILYSTPSVPADLNNEADVAFSKANKVRVVSLLTPCQSSMPTPNGTQVHITDFAPGVETPFHRTLTLDHTVFLEGTVELTLDSGESRLLHRGDVVVQRATMHKWRNVSQTESARLIVFIVDCTKPVLAGGEELKEMRIMIGGRIDAEKGDERAHSN